MGASKQAAGAWQEVESCQTLGQLHEVLVRLRPARSADAATWEVYYRRSSVAYERIAEIDRGHHHEALYWAGRERRKGNAVAVSGRAESVAGETGTL